MPYVYAHIRPDKNQIFYIGVGLKNDGYKRSRIKKYRNKYWNNIVNKNNGIYEIEILNDGLSKKESLFIEIMLIKFYGRKDNNTGILSNMTDGGDGRLGIIVSKETREKMSKAKKELYNNGYVNPKKDKKISEETKKKISKSKKNMLNETKNKISKNHASKKEGWTSLCSKAVIHIITNEIFSSMSQAELAYNLPSRYISQQLRRNSKKCQFKYLN